jgi:hypothetical protein
MFPTGPQAKVLARHQEIALIHPGGEIGNEVFKDMFGKLRQVAPQVSKPTGDNVVCGDVIPQLDSFSFEH